MKNEPSQVLMCYTPHTTPVDADFVGKELLNFQPDVYIPEEPNRSKEKLKLDNIERRYKKQISGEYEIKETVPNYRFQHRLLHHLQKLNSKKPFEVYFLELHPQKIISVLDGIHKRELEHKKLANYLFDLGDLEGALDELYEGLLLHFRTLKVRARNIERNLKSLPEDMEERLPELKEKKGLKILSWISALYSPPIIQVDNCPYEVKPKFQEIPYTQLTHIRALRDMAIGGELKKDFLARSFIENHLELFLRKEIPDSVKRFTKCVSLVSRLEYKDIEELSRQISETRTRDVIITSLLGRKTV